MIHVTHSQVVLKPWMHSVFLLNGERSSHMDWMSHTSSNWHAMVKRSTHTHSTPTRDPPHRRGWAHMRERGSADPTWSIDPPSAPPTLCMHPCKEAQLWCIITLHLMEVWSKEGDGEHMDPWVHLYPSINRGSHPISIHAFKLQVKSSIAPFYLSSIG